MNIDDLKSNWNSLNMPPEYGGQATRDIVSRVERGGVSTLRDRLSAISSRLSRLCFVSIFFMVPFLHDFPVMTVLADCFFIFMGVMHAIACRRVRSLNFSQMTVRESIYRVGIIERDRVRRRAIGMVLAFPLVVYMIFTFTSVYGEYYLYGCITGGVIGLILGFIINRRAVTIIREMRSQLNADTQ